MQLYRVRMARRTAAGAGMKLFLHLFPKVFTTQRLLQIIVVLGATLAMRAYAALM
jgi:hypothetical protein